MIATSNVTADRANRAPQFWLLWVVLCMNVTAGIGVLGQASPMIQEMVPGTMTMHIMAGLLVIGFVCNLLVRPVDVRNAVAHRSSAAAA